MDFPIRWCLRQKRFILLLAMVLYVIMLVRTFHGSRETTKSDDTDHGLYKQRVTPMHNIHACEERHGVVYIKMIKCASETMASIFRRFGYIRDLSFMLPVDNRMYIGWPYKIEKDFYRPAKTGKFNIMCDHAVFDEDLFAEVMVDDAVYVTSIREPFSQFKSMFHYYNIEKITQMEYTDDPILTYLSNLDKYETFYKSPEAAKLRFCIPDGFSMSRNLMSFNLGYPTGSMDGTEDMSQNSTEVKYWLQRLDHKFDLVMIVEYMVESLVLLKRLMCWSIRDVIHVAQNVGDYSYKVQKNDPETMDLYKTWSNVDYLLYEHFNSTFWHKVQQQGPDFTNEVEHLRRTLRSVSQFCSEGDSQEKALHFPRTQWDPAFNITRPGCSLMSKGLLKEVKQVYNNKLPHALKIPTPSIYFC